MNGNGHCPVRAFMIEFGDVHFGKKEFKEDGTRNPITDFIFDKEFVDLLQRIKTEQAATPKKYLIFNGDILDTQLVPMLGRYDDYPLETVAVYKVKEIIGAHPEIFDTLKSLIDDGWVIYWNIGNHDISTAWDGVQNLIRERVAKGQPYDRLVFGDSCDIEKIRFQHGYEIEPHNSPPPPLERFRRGHMVKVNGQNTSIWIPEGLGPEINRVKKKKNRVLEPCTILNAPIGNYMVTEWVSRLKQAGDPNKDGPHRWLGRVRTNQPVWRHSFFHDWKFGFRAGAVWISGWINLLFGSIFDVRRKVTWWQLWWQLLLASIWYTNRDMSGPQTEFGFEILRKNPELRAVVLAHTHVAGVWGNERGVVLNGGTWCIKYELPPPPRGRWARFKNFFAKVKPIMKPWLTFVVAEVYDNDEASFRLCEYDREDGNCKEVV